MLILKQDLCRKHSMLLKQAQKQMSVLGYSSMLEIDLYT